MNKALFKLFSLANTDSRYKPCLDFFLQHTEVNKSLLGNKWFPNASNEIVVQVAKQFMDNYGVDGLVCFCLNYEGSNHNFKENLLSIAVEQLTAKKQNHWTRRVLSNILRTPSGDDFIVKHWNHRISESWFFDIFEGDYLESYVRCSTLAYEKLYQCAGQPTISSSFSSLQLYMLDSSKMNCKFARFTYMVY